MLVPTSGSGVELAGTRRALKFLTRIGEERRQAPPAILVVPNRIDVGSKRMQAVRAIADAAGLPLAPAIPDDPDFAHAFDEGVWIGAFAPRRPAHVAIEALERCVAKELESALQPPALLGRTSSGRTGPPPAGELHRAGRIARWLKGGFRRSARQQGV
ncbi:MAG: hypothetical protein R3C97_14750 [Geminicoccaceae bacterium]